MVKNSFDGVLYAVGERLRKKLAFLPEEIKSKTEEVRLRAGLPVALTVAGKVIFVLSDGHTADYITRNLLTATQNDLDESFRLLCHDSVYAHTDQIGRGFIIMEGGHRAGICGTVTQSGSMRDITSINIRIARQVMGCADMAASVFDGGGMLIAGPPGSGKTTLLRDLVRQLSDGIKGKYYRIAVIDSRGELSGCNGIDAASLGSNTDVLLTQDKAAGSEMALRTMFPDIIAFDEIGTASELKSVSESFNAGVSVITTAHIGCKEDLFCRSVTEKLLNLGVISKVVILSKKAGQIAEIVDCGELLNEYGN